MPGPSGRRLATALVCWSSVPLVALADGKGYAWVPVNYSPLR